MLDVAAAERAEKAERSLDQLVEARCRSQEAATRNEAILAAPLDDRNIYGMMR